MFDSRGSRFVLEVLFLLCLSAALTLADLAPLEIAGIMLIGWVIVAALEWASWRNEAHFGSGLPPRYYVPRVNLPPAQPLEQVPGGYPDAHRDEAPTWIASPALRAEVLGEWPVATQPRDEEPEAPADEPADPWTVVELPSAPIDQIVEPAPVPEPVADTFVARLPEPEPEPKAEPVPELVSDTPVSDIPELEPVAEEPEPEPAEPSADTFVARLPEPEPEAEPAPELVSDTPVSDTPEPEPVAEEREPEPELGVEPVRSVHGVARYSLDPLGDAPPRRRFGRGPNEAPPAVEVPARPQGVRALPGRSGRQD